MEAGSWAAGVMAFPGVGVMEEEVRPPRGVFEPTPLCAGDGV